MNLLTLFVLTIRERTHGGSYCHKNIHRRFAFEQNRPASYGFPIVSYGCLACSNSLAKGKGRGDSVTRGRGDAGTRCWGNGGKGEASFLPASRHLRVAPSPRRPITASPHLPSPSPSLPLTVTPCPRVPASPHPPSPHLRRSPLPASPRLRVPPIFALTEHIQLKCSPSSNAEPRRHFSEAHDSS